MIDGKPSEATATVERRVHRYKVQQDKGEYCLKLCDDGHLVDYSAYEQQARTIAELHGIKEAHKRMYGAWETAMEAYEKLEAETFKLEAAIAEQAARLEAMERYAMHTTDCDKVQVQLRRFPPDEQDIPCTCGLSAAIDGAKTP